MGKVNKQISIDEMLENVDKQKPKSKFFGGITGTITVVVLIVIAIAAPTIWLLVKTNLYDIPLSQNMNSNQSSWVLDGMMEEDVKNDLGTWVPNMEAATLTNEQAGCTLKFFSSTIMTGDSTDAKDTQALVDNIKEDGAIQIEEENVWMPMVNGKNLEMVQATYKVEGSDQPYTKTFLRMNALSGTTLLHTVSCEKEKTLETIYPTNNDGVVNTTEFGTKVKVTE